MYFNEGAILVRRTKEEALATRHRLLDAAELLFQAQGVSRTTLNDIARQAGATRGAIYWHFKDKADLFNAMMERVRLPLEQSFQDPDAQGAADPLTRLYTGIQEALVHIATDPSTRRVFEVATQKVEYIDELQAVRLRHLSVRHEFLQQVERAMKASPNRQEQAAIPVAVAALGLHALIDGLIQNWLLDSTAFDLAQVGRNVLRVYLTGLGMAPNE
jgi:TetR/AcrR family acrAB operon transcriptional repressor